MAPFFKMSQTIGRPVGEVFETATRLDEFPRWSPRNPWAQKLTPGEIGEGTRFQMGIKGFGKVTNELREFERDKRVMVVPLIKMFDGGHRGSSPTSAMARRGSTTSSRCVRRGSSSSWAR
jgi:uncharacterized protein YndB with AHSA1/START domain